MTISISADHAGFRLKAAVIEVLKAEGHTVMDHGAYSEATTDYPDYIHPLAQAVGKGASDMGIAICGSGNGVCMTANKHQAIRAALVWRPDLAQLARAHNNANVLCLPARFISEADAAECVKAFLKTGFEGGRHANRVAKIPTS